MAFSERLRADLDPLTAAQRQAGPLASFSTGAGGTLVSTLRPDGVDPERISQLRNSDVLWSPTGRVRLSWEAVFDDVRFNGQRARVSAGPYDASVRPDAPFANEATMSARGITLPISREFLVVDGTALDPSQFGGGLFPLVGAMLPITVTLTECTGGDAAWDPASPPLGLSTGCTTAEVSAARCDDHDAFTVIPWTVLGCALEFPQDTSLTLHVAERDGLVPLNSGSTGKQESPLPVRPHLKVASDERALARPLVFTAEECRMRDDAGGVTDCDSQHLAAIARARSCSLPAVPGGWCSASPMHWPGASAALDFAALRSEWSFTPEVLPDGRLRENFAPGLAIERIRFFVQKGGGRRYLEASSLRRVRFEASIGQVNRSIRCSLPDGAIGMAEIVVDRDCDFQGAVTPTWAAGLVDPVSGVDALLRWKIGLVVNAEQHREVERIAGGETLVANGILPHDLPFAADDSVFVEFMIAPD